ncbi:MAG: galactose-1-epimerase, partial [Bacteroidota bacterium]
MKQSSLHFFVVILLLSGIFSCTESKKISVEKESWGQTEDGQEVDLYTLKSSTGLEVKISTFGGVITEINTPDKNGKIDNVVLGFDSLQPYLEKRSFFGAIIGRYGNRIADGQFTLDDSTYQLSLNDGSNHLHGGTNGFDQKVWKAIPGQNFEVSALELQYLSKDGEEGYPGNMEITVTYELKG